MGVMKAGHAENSSKFKSSAEKCPVVWETGWNLTELRLQLLDAPNKDDRDVFTA